MITLSVIILINFLTTNGIIDTNVVAAADIHVSIAKSKQVRMINQYSTWEAKLAVDGNLTTDADRCACCAATVNTDYPWFEIDLGSIYRIAIIRLYGRTDKVMTGQNFQKLKMYASDYWRKTLLPAPFYTNEEDTYFLNITLLTPVITQYITLMIDQSQRVLHICELEIFESDCSNGFYGKNCAEKCRCLNNVDCDRTTGRCPDGRCNYMWTGDYCNISSSIAIGKSVRMSNQYITWEAKLAVDGNLRTDADRCACCAATQLTDYPWFEIDLKKPYMISILTLHGRTDVNYTGQSFLGLNIYADQKDNTKANLSTVLYTSNKNTYFLNVTLPTPVISQYITMMIEEKNRLLVICELEIYEKVCPAGKYGIECTSICGQCLGGNVCDSVTGECEMGCQPGYTRPLCNSACSTGYYGKDCAEKCRCRNRPECDGETGRCHDGLCNYMWTGHNCNISTSIAIGKPVRMINQFSTWAASLAVDGNLATDADRCACCAATQYAYNPWFEIDLERPYRIAIITLHGRTDVKPYAQSFQKLQMYASQYSGKTNLSAPFYANDEDTYFLNITLPTPVITQYITITIDDKSRLLLICELQIFEDVCEAGTYGIDCASTCGHCLGDNVCDHSTGECALDCKPGYVGSRCNELQADVNSGSQGGLSTAALGGTIAAAAVLLLVAIVVAVIFKRRSKSNTKKKDNIYTEPSLELSPIDNRLYDAIESEVPETAPDDNTNVQSIYMNEQKY